MDRPCQKRRGRYSLPKASKYTQMYRPVQEPKSSQNKLLSAAACLPRTHSVSRVNQLHTRPSLSAPLLKVPRSRQVSKSTRLCSQTQSCCDGCLADLLPCLLTTLAEPFFLHLLYIRTMPQCNNQRLWNNLQAKQHQSQVECWRLHKVPHIQNNKRLKFYLIYFLFFYVSYNISNYIKGLDIFF